MRLIRFIKNFKGIVCKSDFKVGDEVFSHRFMQFATIKHIAYVPSLSFHNYYIFYPRYYLECHGELDDPALGEIKSGWDNMLEYLNYDVTEMHDWYYIPDIFDWLPDHIGIVGERLNDADEEFWKKMHIALDSPLFYKERQPALRVFPDICQMMNWRHGAILSIFEPRYLGKYEHVEREDRLLTNEEIDELIKCLNTEVPSYWVDCACDDMLRHNTFYSWNISNLEYLKSLPKITVWHQLIWDYNECMKGCDKKDFLDIKMPIPDYTKLKS